MRLPLRRLLCIASGAHGWSSSTRISVPDAIRNFDSLTFIDASWYHKGPRNGRDEFETGPRIARAKYFGTMKPTVQELESAMQDIVSIDSDVVLYGQPGAFFVPRVWFLLRHIMGHEKCRILDGTLADWQAAGGPVDEGRAPQDESNPRPVGDSWNLLTDSSNAPSLMDRHAMLQAVQDRGVILDARGSSFRKGCMPGAINVPYSSLHDACGRLKPVKELAEILAFVEPSADVSVTCGSGVSACTLFLALQEIGHQGQVRVYDGSWSEWKTHSDLPKVTPE